MKILITGGTGLVGMAFIKAYQHQHQFDILSRQGQGALQHFVDKNNLKVISNLNSLSNLNTYDAVINLAGEPIADKRWTVKQKREICQSRWNITKQLSKLINNSTRPPKVFISGSAIGLLVTNRHSISKRQRRFSENVTCVPIWLRR